MNYESAYVFQIHLFFFNHTLQQHGTVSGNGKSLAKIRCFGSFIVGIRIYE